MNTYKTITVNPRCDTRRNWIKINPTLKDKEFVVVYVNKWLTMYKIGDGKRAFKKLPYRTMKHCVENGYIYGQIVNAPEYFVQLVINWKEN